MSTRRARIKAVAALPPRRKNADADAKNKQNVLKEGYEKGPPTPSTPRANNGIKDETKSPIPKPDIISPVAKTVRTPPPLIPISTTKTPTENVPSPRPEAPKEPVPRSKTPQIEKRNSDTQSETVSVITSTFNLNNVVTDNPPPNNTSEKLASPASPNIIDIDSQNRNVIEKTNGTVCDIQNIEQPNIQNVKANHIQYIRDIEKITTKGVVTDNEDDIIVGTPSDSDRERRIDIPDGKFLYVESAEGKLTYHCY